MKVLGPLRRLLGDLARAVQLLAEIRDGIANLTDVTDRRLKAVEAALDEAQKLLADQARGAAPPADVTSAPRPPGPRFFPR